MSRIEKRYLIAAGIAALAFFYSSFFLQGLRLFDNDYNQWLANARENSLPTVLWQIFNPILAEWNVDFRPTQTLLFKVLFALFGYNASGYYFFKSFMLAIFSATYFLFLRYYLNNTIVAGLSALLLIVASSTFTSLYWVSDFVIVSEFLALLVFVLFLHVETVEQPDRTKVVAYLALMILLTLICDRTKANGKLIPGIIFLYIALFDWRKLKRYGLAIALMVLVVLPWPVLLKEPAPFFVAKGGTPAAYAWQPASLSKLWTLFSGDFSPHSLFYGNYPPISVTAILGFPLIYLSIAATAFLLYRRSTVPLAARFMLVWAAVNVAALMSYPTLPQHFQARYAISVLIPLLPLLLLATSNAVEQLLSSHQAATILLTFLAIIQVGFHGYHTVRMRNIGMPGLMISLDDSKNYISTNYRNGIFYYVGISSLAFRPTNDGNQFFSSKNIDFRKLYKMFSKDKSIFVVSINQQINPYFRLVKVFPGKSYCLYDMIFNNEETKHPVTLYLYEVNSYGTF